MKSSLNVYLKERLIGVLSLDEDTQEYSFEYSDSWKKDGFEISPHIGFSKPATSGTIKKFLDNLLPEGKGLEIFSLFFHITKNNTLALTRQIGNETSGALTFFEDKIQRVKTSSRAIKREELTNRILVDDPIQLIIWDNRPRLSVAGVQDKLPIIYHNREYSFGDGNLASTHILKFETNRQRHLVLNEYICMKLAKRAGLDVAEVEIERFKDKAALLVKRFDRIRVSENEIKRVHVIDGCQALNLAPTHKYERNYGSGRDVKHIKEGVSFKKLFDFSQICNNPIKTKLSILRWAFFNLIISNSDAHGKNISFFIDHSGYHLTPYYDLVSIAMYPEFEQDLSMAYGDDFGIDIKAYQIAKMCESCDINPRLASSELKNMAKSIIKAQDESDFSTIIKDKDEMDFSKKLLDHIRERAINYLDIADEIKDIRL